ncbi:MAG: hypothetical protein ABIA04_09605 [Pseudomonadota bacterium]
MYYMNHEKFKCYNELVELSKEVNGPAKKMPRGYAYHGDQLKRARISSILNLAEVCACLDCLNSVDLITNSNFLNLKSRFNSIYSMIFKL